jgi:ribonucleoside-diphosphate reductase beta chain
MPTTANVLGSRTQGLSGDGKLLQTSDWSGFRRQLQELVEQAVELEIAYAEDCLPRGILGLNANLFREYVRHIADRRLERIGLPACYGARNPFPWMSETIDLRKEKNFFETRVTEYQSRGTLSW